MLLQGKRIFVAGATGLAGSAILSRLLSHDDSISITGTRHRTEPFLLDSRIAYVQGDLSSADDCRRMATGCDCAVMVAARASGAGILTTQPWQQVNDNLMMNATLLQALAEAGVRRVVLVGSATLYQPFEGFIREDQLDLNQEPPDAYYGIGWVTRYIEKLCAFWHRQAGMEMVMVRASNIFGPYARFNPETSNFIPALIRKAVDRMDPFEVWGSPDVTRDVIYADDFADAVVRMLERDDIQFDVFNIGSGVRTTVGEVVEWALSSAGHTPSRIDYNDRRPTTIPFRALDCSKARDMLGWAPALTIRQGLEKTVQWWKENKERWSK